MAKEARPVITLECSQCHQRNYATTKNIKTTKDRLELKKYCPRCKKHTVHKESK
jgi:large subunit ribosomal protein L33